MSHACEQRAGLISRLATQDYRLSGFNFIGFHFLRPQFVTNQINKLHDETSQSTRLYFEPLRACISVLS